jgi:hypothetical protein
MTCRRRRETVLDCSLKRPRNVIASLPPRRRSSMPAQPAMVAASGRKIGELTKKMAKAPVIGPGRGNHRACYQCRVSGWRPKKVPGL